MIANLQPYPEYKESGLPWLGRIPAHWRLLRSKYLFREVDERSITGEEIRLSMSQKHGLIPSSRIEEHRLVSESQIGAKVCEAGYLVLNRLKAHLGVFALASERGLVSPDYTVLRPKGDIETRYFEAFYRTPECRVELYKRAKGIVEGFWRLYTDDFYDIRAPVPDTDEQVAMLRFLDHANGRLERAIRAKRRVIALLHEQKQAIIHRAVTRGLDPTVPLKPSGIPWLGDIPSSWGVRRVKQATRILRGKFTHRPRNDPSLYGGQYPFIQTGSVAQTTKFITSYKQTLNEKGLAVSKLFTSGTLVMTIAANIGDVAILTFEACFPDSIVGFVPSEEVDRDYLYLVFLCMKPELLREAPVNTQGNLNVERIGAMGMPFPSFKDQQLIVQRVESETGSFTAATRRLEREIELLREYRTRLVADTVTGKLDVRPAARLLPAEAIDPEAAPHTDELAEPEPEEAEG